MLLLLVIFNLYRYSTIPIVGRVKFTGPICYNGANCQLLSLLWRKTEPYQGRVQLRRRLRAPGRQCVRLSSGAGATERAPGFISTTEQFYANFRVGE